MRLQPFVHIFALYVGVGVPKHLPQNMVVSDHATSASGGAQIARDLYPQNLLRLFF